MNRPRRELIDRIPRVLELSVVTRNGFEATVSVLPSWREKGVLQIELTKENMDLLLESPPAAPAPFTPKITQPDVTWVRFRNQVRCSYWDSKKRGWRTKSELIEFEPDMAEAQMQSIVDREAAAMQEFFLTRHNRANNMPHEDDSAESAHEGPERKAARCHQ